MDAPKDLKTGNKAIAKAINDRMSYVKAHGVNPAGRPGWSQTPEGWVPPYVFGGSSETVAPWDLVPAPVEDPPADPAEWVVFDPQVVWKREDVTATVTITNDPFAPEVDQWLVATITSLSTPAITIECIGEWSFYPSAYDFGSEPDYEFATAHIPLWRFYAADGDGRIQFGDGLYGKKLIQPYPSLEYRLHEIASNILGMVIDLR